MYFIGRTIYLQQQESNKLSPLERLELRRGPVRICSSSDFEHNNSVFVIHKNRIPRVYYFLSRTNKHQTLKVTRVHQIAYNQ